MLTKLSGRKKCGRKRCTTNRENRSLMRIVKQNRFKNWVNFTRNGLRLGSRHQEPPHTDVSRNVATVVVFLLLSHSWNTDNVRGVLPGLRRRRTGLLPSGPKSSFQMRASFVFHLEIKVLESGGRVEKLIAQVAWSPVFKFPQSVMIWGAMSSAGVGPLCFEKPTSLHPFTKKFWSTSCFLLLTSFLKMLISFSAGFGTCPHCQKHQKLVKWPWCYCAWLASKLTRPWGIVKRKWETRDQKMQMSWRPLSKKPGLPYHLSSAINWSPPCHAELRQ